MDQVPQVPEEPKTEQIVTPWEVDAKDSGIDYTRLIKQFGTIEISQELLIRIEKITKKPVHPWLKRGLFFSHRSLDELLTAVESGKPFYLYTGRGPSSEALHLGHMIPFLFTKYLQEAFDVPLVIQLTDDEKFLWKDLSLEETHRLAFENAKDIIAVGFDPKKTFIFSDLGYIGSLYPTICKIQKCIKAKEAAKTFGFNEVDNNIGQYAFPAVQAAPSFSSCFPHIFGPDSNYHCLIPCAIDQDPFFRLTRDVAPKLGFLKPAVIHAKFFPALQGSGTKMSASSEISAIFMTDSPAQIEEKIVKHAFSGGLDTLADHRKYGANVDIDVSYQYLTVFMFDDVRLEQIRADYSSGKMLTKEIKKILADELTPLILKHQTARQDVTDDMVREFMRIRPLEFGTSSKK
jgi:tryptophanyl-tRNA synthetase